MNAKVKGPLEVLRAELESLPVMAAMASVNGVKCDSSEAEANLAQAIAQVEALVEAAQRANGAHTFPNDCYATGPLTGDPYRDLIECPGCVLASTLEAFTPGQDSEGSGNG